MHLKSWDAFYDSFEVNKICLRMIGTMETMKIIDELYIVYSTNMDNFLANRILTWVFSNSWTSVMLCMNLFSGEHMSWFYFTSKINNRPEMVENDGKRVLFNGNSAAITR